MYRIGSAFSLAAVVVFASTIFAEAKARRIVQKAIQAHGGAANVAKMQKMRMKLEGTMYLDLGQGNVPCTLERWQGPKQFKSMFKVENELVREMVIDGDKIWVKSDGKIEELEREQIDEIRERQYVENLSQLGFLNDKQIKLSSLHDTLVSERPAVSILVKSKGHRDVKLYFDKTSGFLVKREVRVFDYARGNVQQEIMLSDYRERNGLKLYTRIVEYRGGKKIIEARVTAVQFFERLDTKVFVEP